MSELRPFLINMLDGRNSFINKIYADFNKKEQFQKMIDDLCLTEQSFEPTLKRIASLLLSNSKNNGRLTVLLLFSMELDSFHSLNSSWYKRDMLIETLYNILLDRERIEEKEEEYPFWEYTLILLICSIVLIII